MDSKIATSISHGASRGHGGKGLCVRGATYGAQILSRNPVSLANGGGSGRDTTYNANHGAILLRIICLDLLYEGRREEEREEANKEEAETPVRPSP